MKKKWILFVLLLLSCFSMPIFLDLFIFLDENKIFTAIGLICSIILNRWVVYVIEKNKPKDAISRRVIELKLLKETQKVEFEPKLLNYGNDTDFESQVPYTMLSMMQFNNVYTCFAKLLDDDTIELKVKYKIEENKKITETFRFNDHDTFFKYFKIVE